MSETVRFATGAVRSADAEDVRFDLIPSYGLEAVARTCHEGASKYGDRNWEKGMAASGLLNHAWRHLNLFSRGDKSEPHLAHAAWNILAAIDSIERWPNLNPEFSPKEGQGFQEMKLYISGPITGDPDYRQHFAEAESMLRSAGVKNLCNPASLGDVEGWQHEDYMRRDLPLLLGCHWVVLLPGWLDSKGCRIEVRTAVSAGISIFSLEDALNLLTKEDFYENLPEADCFLEQINFVERVEARKQKPGSGYVERLRLENQPRNPRGPKWPEDFGSINDHGY